MSRLDIESALLSGLPIGAGQVAHCDVCGACLRPNHRVEVLVTVTGTQIDPAVTRCRACAKSRIHPETERDCLLVSGRVAPAVTSSGRSQLVLSGADVVDRTDD